MSNIEKLPELKFLSELYAADAPTAMFLTEYPSSNSDETQFQNKSKYIIHDPFPPPPRKLIKVLGPHHLMCGWGNHLPVTSEIPPPSELVDHWRRAFGDEGCPTWKPFDLAETDSNFITMFPHESLPAERQAVNPDVSYELHSKNVIAEIDCPQADVLDQVTPPCLVKLSHGYAGLGNFFIRNANDQAEMEKLVSAHWPTAQRVINSILEDINGDFCVQFYLRKNGSIVWLGFTQQLFDPQMKWCGGTYSAHIQDELLESFSKLIEPAGRHLHQNGYFGLIGIDILRDKQDRLFLVDVNPRLNGSTPLLMCSRIFAAEGLSEGLYQASCEFNGSFAELIAAAEQAESDTGAKVIVLSAIENATATTTTCHLSVTSDSQAKNQTVLAQLLAKDAS